MRRLTLMGVLAMCLCCGTVYAQDDAPLVIHPTVFSLVECWLSDTTQPVVTEINLDAVQRNGNQFFGQIVRDGDWVSVTVDERGLHRYRVLSRDGDSYRIEFQHNGGGTLTTRAEIGFSLVTRAVVVDGKSTELRLLRVHSIRTIPQDER